MIVGELRETLQRRAEAVEPSLDGWSEINRRIERRQRRTHTLRVTLVAGMSFATVALAVAVITVGGPDTADQDLAATGGTAPVLVPTTTEAFAAPPSAPPGDVVPGQDGGPGEGGGASGPTTVPRPRAPSDGVGSDLLPLWPETLAELDAAQEAVDQGHQPWRADPDGVVSAYLAALGLAPAEVGVARVGTEAAGALRYTAGGVGGWVSVSRVPNGSVYFVESSRSDRLVQLRFGRQGDRLGVDIVAASPGRVVVRTKQPGSGWNQSASASVSAGRLVGLEVDGPASSTLIVQVRHEGDDGGVGIAESLLPSTLTDMGYDALHEGSAFGLGHLGPVNLEESMDNVAWLAGIPMAYERTEHCATWSPVDRPEGVAFVSTGGDDRVDIILVEAAGIRTGEGVGVGATVADVRRAYPGIEERLTGDRGRLVYTPADPGRAGYEMVFGISDGVVGSIWSGYQGLSMSDEICA